MKDKIFMLFILLVSFSYILNNYNSTITFSNSGVTFSGEGVEISGTIATIKNPGSYLVTGSSSEGNIIISVGSVELYLQNLELNSSITSPIIVNSKLENVKIISLGNVILQDLEEQTTTKGECAVIKVKKKSTVTFSNQNDFKLIGKCKNVIKGGSLANIIFDDSNGEYTINGYKNGIASDNLVQFNGGKFTITTETGDGIKSSPDDTDTESLGRIFIYSGTFNIQSYSDAFQAANKLTIIDGNFIVKTENGYDSKTFDGDTMSAKGFKVSNNKTGCEMRIYNGNFDLNTADDAFHSDGNMTLINGNYKIYSGDDALHSEFHLIIGTKDQSKTPNINILYSYEAIEGMSIRIYSGKINATAKDDGINAAGADSGEQFGPGPDQGHGPGRPDHGPGRPDQDHAPGRPEQGYGPKPNLRNLQPGPRPMPGPGPNPGPNPGPGPHPGPGGRGNASYFLSIYGGDINIICAGDGLDSNGNIFIHGGNINIFSQAGSEGNDNEPLDHEGNLTLFDGTILGAGNKGMEYVHTGILKGNQMYAFYNRSITANSVFKVKNENNEIIKEVTFPKTVSYTFFTCKGLTNNYKFYLSNKNGTEFPLSFYFGNPKSGLDDQDTKTDDGGKYDGDIDPTDTTIPVQSGNDEKIKGDNPTNSDQTLAISLGVTIPIVIISVIVLVVVFTKCKKKDVTKEIMLEDESKILED